LAGAFAAHPVKQRGAMAKDLGDGFEIDAQRGFAKATVL
jgi:hypothetical protein